MIIVTKAHCTKNAFHYRCFLNNFSKFPVSGFTGRDHLRFPLDKKLKKIIQTLERVSDNFEDNNRISRTILKRSVFADGIPYILAEWTDFQQTLASIEIL